MKYMKLFRGRPISEKFIRSSMLELSQINYIAIDSVYSKQKNPLRTTMMQMALLPQSKSRGKIPLPLDQYTADS